MICSERLSSAGFTVVELVLVIVVLGILSALAIPRFASQATFENRFFVDDLVHGARYARQFAVAKGCYTQVNLTATGFQIYRDDDCDSTAFNFTSLLPRPEDANENYTNSEAPAGTVPTTITFSPQGRAGFLAGAVFMPFAVTLTLTIGDYEASVYGESGFVR